MSLSSVAENGSISVISRYYFKYTCDGIAFSPKHNSILIAERNMPFINYISLETQEKKEVSINQHEWDAHVSFCVTDIALFRDDDYVVALTDKGNAIVYEYGRNEHVQTVYGGSMLSDSYYNGCVAVDSSERFVLTMGCDHSVHVFSLYTGKEVTCVKGHTSTVRNMYYAAGLRPLLFTCSYDHSIRVWGWSVCQKQLLVQTTLPYKAQPCKQHRALLHRIDLLLLLLSLLGLFVIGTTTSRTLHTPHLDS